MWLPKRKDGAFPPEAGPPGASEVHNLRGTPNVYWLFVVDRRVAGRTYFIYAIFEALGLGIYGHVNLHGLRHTRSEVTRSHSVRPPPRP